VALQQLVEPTIVPPPPIYWYLRGITTRKVEMMINDLLDEAIRIKGVSATESNIHQELSSIELKLDEITDDKERWVLRRRKARRTIFLSKNSQRWHGKMSSPKVAKENKHQIRETEHLLKLLMSSFSVNQRLTKNTCHLIS
nr:hypothetical protein [Tanacetum cinerariifolium]